LRYGKLRKKRGVTGVITVRLFEARHETEKQAVVRAKNGIIKGKDSKYEPN
jgi:hypothetical protein